ncbi:hypothetical protein HID58_093563 [Brassica napus]|uniref:F-box associated domain-containing protein n=1 Tax=Brassica napus TaxID=3708 RepID=A0ABQ7XAI4_BRANA|nr:hypothetical protein HID58_093563 [Brassica napus]
MNIFSFTGLLRMGYPTDILSLVSYGDMYIYMARCQPEHRTLSSWIMGLSDGRWQYIEKETSTLVVAMELCYWCNGMFLFWTRHFAITMFIDIIKEHQLLQLVMKHLNWCNGYWLVLSCIKNRFSPVEYQVVCFLWLSMVVLWRRDLKNLQMQIRCLDDWKTLSASFLVCRVTVSVKIKYFYDFCVEIWSSKDKMDWVMSMHCFLLLDFGHFVLNDEEFFGGSLSLPGVWSWIMFGNGSVII